MTKRRTLALRLAICTVSGCIASWIAACGIGHYNDEATLDEVTANDGIANHGQWWPWVCADGSTPTPQSPNVSYAAQSDCGAGGAFVLNVDGCQINGSWGALGLTNVSTTTPSSTPTSGGWQVDATAAGNANTLCTAKLLDATGAIQVACQTTDADAKQVCLSTLDPVNR